MIHVATVQTVNGAMLDRLSVLTACLAAFVPINLVAPAVHQGLGVFKQRQNVMYALQDGRLVAEFDALLTNFVARCWELHQLTNDLRL